MFSCTQLALMLGAVSCSNAATYRIAESLSGARFLDFFTHEAIPDPTHGRVNYVSRDMAMAKNLTFARGNTFIIRTDFTTTLSSSGPGRDSVRLQSKTKYETHVVIMNIRHMPSGCGTWPAVWEVGDNWPQGGEVIPVDVIEGVNGKGVNQATLHTTAPCQMPFRRDQTGKTVNTDCNVAVHNNAGCGVQVDKQNSFATNFNDNRGGWYAMERTNSHIRVWFWPRDDGSVPADVREGVSSINTSNWGTPFANFPNNGCDLRAKLGPNNIIINISLCGDWAGSAFGSQCGGDCTVFVNNNPRAFRNAYFEFESMHVYT